MNILYVSHLSGASYAGPTYSVPKQIEAQTLFDNVFWYNATYQGPQKWKSLPYYHDLSEYPNESICGLPGPFNHPDVIIAELFYNMAKSKLRVELINGSIPYIIIPRGELTQNAQNRKKLKKTIANILFCKRYAKRAAAIQYLTEQEYRDSGDSWNERAVIIPNGIDLPPHEKKEFPRDRIRCVSIGRIEPYQKGLDLLIEACKESEKALRESNCTISIFGPDNEKKAQSLIELIKEKGLEGVISIHDAVYGEEKAKILRNSDVFILPSRFEGHPMALIEALSYGLPCIVTTGSNMRGEIEKYDAGWTADNRVSALSDAINKMIAQKKGFGEKSKNAINLSMRYSWTLIAKKTHSILENVISQE